MKNKLLLDTFRTIQKSLGKYVLLLLIVLMGVSFFSGMLSISSAMGQSVDRYADEYALFDFQIISNYGFDDEDIKKIEELGEEYIVEGAYFYDVAASFDENDYVFRVESYNEENQLNRFKLVNGRYPTKPDEVLVEMQNDLFDVPKIGDKITLERSVMELEEIFEYTEYTVVGVVQTPNYMSLEKGTSTLDNLTLNSFMYLSEDAFLTEVYSAVYVGSEEARSLNSFSEEYAANIEYEKGLIEELSSEAQLVRADNIKLEALEEYNEGLQAYNDAVAEFNAEMEEGQRGINLGYEEINTTRQGINPAFMSPEMIAQIEAELLQTEQTLSSAQYQLNNAYSEGVSNFESLLEELDDAKIEIDELEVGKWTTITREMHYPMVTYKDTVMQMQVIGLIFPIFYFLVAALVCLTTMKRMIDEQRGQVGILRALGYSRFKCASKYLIYALSATVIGGIVGAAIGIMLFPPLIYNTWNIMYNLPPLDYVTPWFNMLLAIVIFALLMGVVTYSCIKAETAEVASALLRPKAPPAGKKVLLEKISFLWKRLSFTGKITIRNLFRYKQRFFMSVVGIAGCTSLLLTGFGMQSSIGGIADIQYNELTQYDALITTRDDIENTRNIFNSIASIYDGYELQSISTYASETVYADEEVVAYVQVYENDETLKEMNIVRELSSSEELILTNNSILISVKLSELLGVNVGDEISIQSINEKNSIAKVGGIYEKYINHEIFISESYYETLFSEELKNNAILLGGSGDIEADRDEILKLDNVNGITLNESIISSFDNISTSMNIVVAVIIVSAAGLAFVVLGNLTNTNISERKREIATLKVLGFTHRETKDYIFNENMILTLFGSLLGVAIGIFAHNFIITQVEMDFIMFDRSISISSIIYSVLLTFVFSIVLNRIMLSRIKKIDMIESLKSVE